MTYTTVYTTLCPLSRSGKMSRQISLVQSECIQYWLICLYTRYTIPFPLYTFPCTSLTRLTISPLHYIARSADFTWHLKNIAWFLPKRAFPFFPISFQMTVKEAAKGHEFISLYAHSIKTMLGNFAFKHISRMPLRKQHHHLLFVLALKQYKVVSHKIS